MHILNIEKEKNIRVIRSIYLFTNFSSVLSKKKEKQQQPSCTNKNRKLGLHFFLFIRK